MLLDALKRGLFIIICLLAFESTHGQSKPDVKFDFENNLNSGDHFFKGQGLQLTASEVISSWPTGFPSDHYLIVSKFKLNY